MVPEMVCRSKIATLASCLPSRDGSQPESQERLRTYYRHLGNLNEADFVEACDRILFDDDWFPTIARIRAVAAECGATRQRSARAVTVAPALVCPACHGARWVRTGGYDPLNMHAGESGSRVQPCPRCTTAGMHDEGKEAWTISNEGGVPNESAERDIDLSRTTWRVPRTAEGGVDMAAMYRQSRTLRGLDPNVDARPRGVGTWRTIGDVIAPGPVREPERELVTATADWSVDDVPFD